MYPGLSQLNMIVFLIYKLKSLFFLPDVNFDEYDKSDDPPDYKFVRWLTKEKVGRKTFNFINNRTSVQDLWFFIYLEIFFCLV